jgi:hypothetical protein
MTVERAWEEERRVVRLSSPNFDDLIVLLKSIFTANLSIDVVQGAAVGAGGGAT